MREKYDFCLHIEYCFYLLLMRIGPVFLMGFCINVITVRLHRKFHIKDKDVFLKDQELFKKEQELFQKQQDVFDAFLLVLHNMAKYLVFLSEVSASPQTSCSSAFSLKDIHDKILQPKKIFQRDRVSDVVLVGFLSVFGFTFIHLLIRLKERTTRLKDLGASICQPEWPIEQDVCGEAETSEGFLGHSSREGYFSSKDGYAYQKEGGKTLKTCRKMSQFL